MTHTGSHPQDSCAWLPAYLTDTGTGYLQSNFEAVCPGCKFSFKKENLAVLKFARDLVLDHRNSRDKQKYGLGVYLA